MYTLLSILIIYIDFSYATNCYELQQAQISSLNDRMYQMLNSFYTPLPQNPIPAVAAASSTDYSNPYNVYPYPYPLPQNIMYGPSPAFYTPPPVPSVQGTFTPSTKPPAYYNPASREYNAVPNWASYYDSYPQYYEHPRPSPYEPLVLPSPYPPSPFPTPFATSLPHPSQSITPYTSSTSPPPPFYPSWEYAPYNPEYATRNYTTQIPPYAVPPPPSPLPSHYPYYY